MHHLLFYDLCRVQIAIECNLATCTSIRMFGYIFKKI